MTTTGYVEDGYISGEDLLIANAFQQTCYSFLDTGAKLENRRGELGIDFTPEHLIIDEKPPYDLVGGFDDAELNRLFINLAALRMNVIIMAVTAMEARINMLIFLIPKSKITDQERDKIMTKWEVQEKYAKVPKLYFDDTYTFSKKTKKFIQDICKHRNVIAHTKFDHANNDGSPRNESYMVRDDRITDKYPGFIHRVMQLPFKLNEKLKRHCPDEMSCDVFQKYEVNMPELIAKRKVIIPRDVLFSDFLVTVP